MEEDGNVGRKRKEKKRKEKKRKEKKRKERKKGKVLKKASQGILNGEVSLYG
jgi:hypothetical protein